jgi:DNA (cytosine-5)-methyltransferase 1
LDEWAAETFKHNHPDTDVLIGDITTFSDDTLMNTFGKFKPDIILGGPPCQGFSICVKNAGDSSDPRNTLFTQMIRVGKLFAPRFIIIENVPNLLNAKTAANESVIEIILAELKRLGYFVSYSVLESTSYGVPQIRKRLIVIASKKKLKRPFPEATHAVDGGGLFNLKKTPSLWDAISDMPIIEACEGDEIMEYAFDSQNDYQDLLRDGADRVYNHKAMNHTKRTVERFSVMKWGQSTADVPEHLMPYKRNGNGVLAATAYDQNSRRMYPGSPCHTIPASFYANFVHPYRHRNFTAREGARIQSFPDRYRFLGKPTVVSRKLLKKEGRDNEQHLCQYNQIGNAVPPLLSKAIAKNIGRQA